MASMSTVIPSCVASSPGTKSLASSRTGRAASAASKQAGGQVKHRTYDFLLRGHSLRLFRKQDSRFVEPTIETRRLLDVSAGQRPRATLEALADQARDFLKLLARHDRSEIRIIETAAEAESFHPFGELRQKRLRTALLKDEAGPGRANLAGMHERGSERSRERLVHVGVLVHDQRRLATQLQCH